MNKSRRHQKARTRPRTQRGGSHEDRVRRARRQWNAKHPTKARRITWTWGIYWTVAVLATATAVVLAVTNYEVLDGFIVVLLAAGVFGIGAGLLAMVFSTIRNEPSDPTPTWVEPGG